MKFSIIIPCREKTKYLEECVKKIKEMGYSDYEIIIVPDKKIKMKNTKILPLKDGPAEKRDYAAKKAKGEILAFIDDDAYPDKDWLKNSLKYFKKGYEIIGGPGINPPNDNFMQKIGGYIISSLMAGGFRARYKKLRKNFEVDDWPSANLLIKKKVFKEVEGFKSKYYPGEDMRLCFKIKNKGYKILYAHDVIVYHHRRALLLPHLKQISYYGLHRGYSVKKHPKYSFRLNYFLPSIFIISIIIGTIFFPKILSIMISIYYLFGFIEGLINSKNLLMALIIPFGIFITHITYGAYFIKGLLINKL